MTASDKIEHASLTDVGIRRSHNQDAHAVLLASDAEHWRKQGHVFLVADGMGAHAVGELASELAATIIPLTYHKYAADDAEAALQKAFHEANNSIHARGQQNREFQGMGTTGTVLVLRPEGAWVGHVGDSRCYRLRDGKMEQLSFDHSLVWELARRMKVKPEGLQGVPSNVIVRSLGPDSDVEVDVEGPHPVRPGDVYLLCSDGLSGQVTDTELGAVAGTLPPAEACQFLVDLANLRGGPDNITVVIVRVHALPEEAAPAAAGARRRWYSRVPWPTWPLVIGGLLAARAVLLFGENSRNATTYVVAAAVAGAVGLSGLAYYLLTDKPAPVRKRSRPRLRLYAQAPCVVEQPLVDRIVKAATVLAQFTRERDWDADWETYERHRKQAEELLARNDFAGAFREYCRSMRPLTEVLQQHRHKAEVFQPIWEKMTE